MHTTVARISSVPLIKPPCNIAIVGTSHIQNVACYREYLELALIRYVSLWYITHVLVKTVHLGSTGIVAANQWLIIQFTANIGAWDSQTLFMCFSVNSCVVTIRLRHC